MTVSIRNDITELVARLQLVPTSLREFTASAADAAHEHGLDAAALAALEDAGLAVTRTSDGTVTYDPLDLANAALHLGCRSMQRRALTSWRQTLDEVTLRGRAEYRLSSPGAPVVAGEVSALDRAQAHEGSAFVTLELPTDYVPMPDDVAEVVSGLDDLEFFALPLPLRSDEEFARRSRMAGCRMAARLLVADLTQAGLPARVRSGFLLSLPFITPHSWFEVPVDEEWTPFDPHLINMLRRHAGLDVSAWPVTRSPGAVLAPYPLSITDSASGSNPDPLATTVLAELIAS